MPITPVRPVPPSDAPQVIVHSVSGLFITPVGHTHASGEVRLWRGGLRTGNKQDMWEFLAADEQGLWRIKNGQDDLYLTVRDKHPKAVVYQDPWSDSNKGQLWRMVQADPAQADVVIASALDERLVISPVESCQSAEATLEVDQVGPYSDQFWRWRSPRG
ncbi:RICIN domain-containing protein [Streptomyces sp. NPDC001118]|uniref:RICIN domain-containing protein n=1 Tax=Streptomyces sp. CG4 TaxID=408783 RepID=UPI0034E1AECB